MADISPEVVFGMFFLTLSNIIVVFFDQELWWRTYTTEKALQTTKYIELVRKKQFAAASLDPEQETFLVYIVSLSFTPLDVHLAYKC